MRAKEYLNESDNRQFVEKYIPWIADQLGIQDLPRIELLDAPVDTTFGRYDPKDKSLSLVIANRHPIDVLRTLAHELTHHKQNLAGELTAGAGETGTPQENEANANAGVIMRDFAKENPEYFGLKKSGITKEAFNGIDISIEITKKKQDVAEVNETIRKVKGGYKVLSKKGKNLGGPYPSRAQAARRLGQVEYFKHMKENEDVDENFADGKKPGRKGLSKRLHVNTKGTAAELEKRAHNATGEKQRMLHFVANMKKGHAKKKHAKEDVDEAIGEKKLVIFDIDDTLVTTNTRVGVIRDGKTVKTLDSHEFTHYKLQPGETFDFGAFRDAEDFFQHAQPIAPMIEQLKNDIATGNRVVMVTARADFNSKEIFLKTFEQWHVDMSKVHVYRAGNDTDPVPIDEKKARIIRRLLNGHAYNKAIMYDDSRPNLESFLRLRQEYPDTRFYAWHVDREGHASEFARAVDEESVVTEIEKIRADDYTGGKDVLQHRRYTDPQAVKKKNVHALPGGSGLYYAIVTDPFIADLEIRILDKTRTTAIGKLALNKKRDFPIKNLYQVSTITVDEDYRGQGIAKAMYGVVLSILKLTLLAGSQQTPGGRRSWMSLAQIPGVEVRGFVMLDERDLKQDNNIDTLMGKLGGDYLGEVGDLKMFAFDVVPGTGQLAPAVKTQLNKLYYSEYDLMYETGLFARWHGA